MKRSTVLMLVIGTFFLLCNSVLAYPLLQLDIANDNASYDPSNETIVTADPTFDVVALLNSDSGKFDNKVSLATEFTLVASWNTATGDTFSLGGNTVTLGTTAAPGNPQLNHGELGSYAYELDFDFVAGDTTTAYNTQDNPGGFAGDVGGPFYFVTFAVDVSGLDPFVPIHFDLYAYEDGSTTKKVFAPFSHDATVTPEPATMLLLGSGLIGLMGFRKKFRKK